MSDMRRTLESMGLQMRDITPKHDPLPAKECPDCGSRNTKRLSNQKSGGGYPRTCKTCDFEWTARS